MKHRPYVVILIIVFMLALIWYYSVIKVSVNPKISDDFKKGIERTKNSQIQIKKIAQSQNQYFVLFEDSNKRQISIVYYVPHIIFRNRYIAYEGPNHGTKFTQNYGYDSYGFGWAEDGVYKTLGIVYGDNQSGIAKRYVLKFSREVFGENIINGLIIENKIESGYFIDVYRYKQKGLSDEPKLSFYDEKNNPIILK